MDKKIISIINQKGGVGKTTTVINLAAGLIMKGKKILVIDLDPQGNATTGLGLSNTENSELTIYSVLNGNKKISEVVQSTKFENLSLVTSNVGDGKIPGLSWSPENVGFGTISLLLLWDVALTMVSS